MTEKRIEQLESRVNDLECQLAFQEQTIEELNEALSQQQMLITRMQDQMKFVAVSYTHLTLPTILLV